MEIRLKKEIQALKFRYVGLQAFNILGYSLLFFSAAASLLTGLSFLGASPFIEGDITVSAISTITLVIALCLGFTIVGLTKQSFYQEIVAADKRLGLLDKLSTAVEFSQKNAQGYFVNLLIWDAKQTIRQYTGRLILPYKFNKWFFLIFLFTLISLSFHYDLFSMFNSKMEAKELNPLVIKIEEKIKEFGEELFPDENQTDQNRAGQNRADQNKIFRQIQKSKKDLQQSGYSKKEALRSLSGLLDVVQNENANKLKELEDNLNLDDLSEKPNQGSSQSAPRMTNTEQEVQMDLDDLKEKVKEAFENDTPKDLSDELNDLENRLEFEQYIKNSMEDLQNEEDSDDSDNSDGEGDLDDSSSVGKRSDKDRGDNSLAEGDGSSQGNGPNNSGKQGDGNQTDDDPDYKAGTGESDGSSKTAGIIKKNESPVTKDKSGLYNKGAYQYSIRALSGIGMAEKSDQEIQKEYIKQNEAVLLKESIPPEYREMIKDYFLSIGLEKE